MKRKTLLLSGLLLGSLLSLAPSSARAEDTFTLAVVPDTQQEVLDSKDTRLKDRFQWLVDNRKKLNLKMMLQSGDFVNWDTPDHFQYERASDALTVLDKAKLPYSLAIGNHDTAATKQGGSAAPGNVHDNQRNTSTFNKYFGVERHKGLEGMYPSGKVDNAYQTFTAGGLNWLAINLELWARTEAVDWAKKVVESHPNHNIIIVTHSHLTSQSTIEQRNGGYGDNSPQYVFDQLMKPYPNVRLIFSGHTGIHGYRTDVGAKGNTIYEFLETYHSNIDNPVRLVEIDTKKGTIKTHVYCPSVKKDRDDGSAFTVTGIQWVPVKGPAVAAKP
jgi:DNA repair exonuclease SbcCD nuclease subunit